MAKSVKINYILNLVNTVLGIIFPLITLPYVTRILSPNDLGQVQFYSNIIGYITLFTSFGIPLYGVREIAKLRHDVTQRNTATIELLLLHTVFTAIGYVCAFIMCMTVGKIQENIPLFGILSLGLFFNTIGCSWFFQAMEDFMYITIRSLIVKILSILLLFSLVRTESDILLYAIVLIIGSAGNNVFNLIRLKSYISRTSIDKKIRPFSHIKPAGKVFILNLTIGIYTQLSIFLLGFLQSNSDVSYYSMAEKIVGVINTVVLSLSTVLLPRLSQYVGSNQMSEFKALGDKAISFVLAISVPICFGLITLSKPIVLILFGDLYTPTIPVLAIWAPIIVIIGLSQVFGKSILYSTGQEMLMTKCTFIGMITYFIIGIPAIKYYSIIGAAICALCTELAVTMSMILLGRKHHPCTLLRKENLTYIVASLIMAIPIVIITQTIESSFVQLVISIPIGIVVYFMVLALVRNRFYEELKQIVLKYVRK